MVIGCMGILLLASTTAGFLVWRTYSNRNKELEEQLSRLQEQENYSVVDRMVSKQMEEIAYSQQQLSDERSQEAIRQKEIAEEMTVRSETERQNAIRAQAAAEASAQEALESAQMAEQQKKEAIVQRSHAEHARQVADTLNYRSLGRTLGSQSYAIYRAGDRELGNLLAYASYLYTKEYGGDLYGSSVFPALTQSAGGKTDWNIHHGSISDIDFMPDTDRLFSVSLYGEIYHHELKGGTLNSKRVFSDKQYRFRDAFASTTGKGYFVSYTGHLVIVRQDYSTMVVELPGLTRPFKLEAVNDGRQLLIVGERNMALLDIATDRVISSRQLNFNVACCGRRDYKPLLFDSNGRMHLVNDMDHLTDEKVPVAGKVTSFASSKNVNLKAYGMSDGTIYLVDDGGKVNKLVGHLSRVTKMKFNGRRLYSSSYDGKLLFWMTSDSQIKPITLFQTGSWLTCFTFDNRKEFIWAGGLNGNISQYLISLPLIAQRLKSNVNRNLTKEEWDHYVGKGIPYRDLKVNSEK